MVPGILDQAITHIINHPGEWDQSAWFCGTKACLAGRVCLLAGAQPLDTEPGDGFDLGMVGYQGEIFQARELAAQLAGLTEWEAYRLWRSDNTMPELYELVNTVGLDLALPCWAPATDESYGPRWADEDGRPCLSVHRRSVAYTVNGLWRIRHHPSRLLAVSWADEYADKHHLTLTHAYAELETQP